VKLGRAASRGPPPHTPFAWMDGLLLSTCSAFLPGDMGRKAEKALKRLVRHMAGCGVARHLYLRYAG